ncbi:hypothetical protein [Pseudomonas sp. PGPR40]|nr:hypothetical protein [Pseudomonas sp. PGPR40]
MKEPVIHSTTRTLITKAACGAVNGVMSQRWASQLTLCVICIAVEVY